jgi:hypothetical protein
VQANQKAEPMNNKQGEFFERRGFWFFFPEKKNTNIPDVLSALPAEKRPNGSIPVNGMIIDLQKRYKTIHFRNYRHPYV